MGRKLEHIEKIDRAIGRKKLFLLLPVFLFLVAVDIMVHLMLEGRMDESAEEMIQLLNGAVAMVICMGAMFFVIFYYRSDPSFLQLPAAVQARLDADCMGGYRAGSVIVCRDGLLYVNVRMQVVPYQDMVWIYRRNKKYLTVVCRSGITSNLLLTYKLPVATGPQIDGDSLLAMLKQSLPWCFFDRTKDNRKLRRRNFKQMVQMVDARRGQISGGMGI